VDRAERETSELAWVEANSAMVNQAFQDYLREGEWPDVGRLQRSLDQSGSPIDVAEALGTMPSLPGELRAVHSSWAVVPMRFLNHVPRARSILNAALTIVKLGVDAYYSSSLSVEPTVSSDDTDPLIIGRSWEVWFRAAQLVFGDRPNPFGGATWTPESRSWSMQVNGSVARKMQGLIDISDYFDRQAAILAEAQTTRAATMSTVTGTVAPPTQSDRPTVFTLMPFTTNWSIAAYDLFQRAAASIDVEPSVFMYRADDIEASGRITDQIKQAILECDVVLADVTGVNPNVMWELGYAHALDRQVVIVSQNPGSDPFDLAEWRQVEYSRNPTPDDVRRIATFLRRALGL
jgi:hypothetical protein